MSYIYTAVAPDGKHTTRDGDEFERMILELGEQFPDAEIEVYADCARRENELAIDPREGIAA